MAAAWRAVILALSSVPGLSLGLSFDDVLGKGADLTEYAIFFLLLRRAVGRERPASALGVGYVGSDEPHQHVTRGRQASPLDVAIDSARLLGGLVVWQRVTR